MRSIASLSPAVLLSGSLLLACGGLRLDSNSISYPMTLEAQEFKHDFGADFQNQMGSFPTVDCAANAQVCSMIPNLPAGAITSCDKATNKCVASYDLRLPVPVDLSKQTSLPPAVTNSSVISDVQVSAVHYWTASNSLNFDTPPIDVYIGGQTAMKETDAGVSRLGTLPSIARGMRTGCKAGSPGTAESACDMPLTEDGKRALATLARSFRSPFNVLLVAHLTLRAGDPYPLGVIDLFLQPVIAFVLPLS